MWADLLGTRLYYEDQGTGLPLVCVHGLGGTSSVWHAVRGTLSKSFRVVTLDLTGSGRSDKSRRQYSMERWCEEIAALLEHLHITSAVLVGHSMGTVIVQNFAACWPELTQGLVLCGGLTELNLSGKEAFTRRAEIVTHEGMPGVADLVLSGALSPATREGNLVLTGLVREMLLANDPACYAGHCQALIHGSAREAQPRIACPTLLLVGDQDLVTPLSQQQQMAAVIPHSQLRVIPHTAHLTMAERPETFHTLLLEFLLTLNH